MSIQGDANTGILVVIQVIFGTPLKDKEEFHSGDVGRFTTSVLGTANHIRTLHKLTELGWLSAREIEPIRGYPGRSPRVMYRRTSQGKQNYASLRQVLSRFSIKLE